MHAQYYACLTHVSYVACIWMRSNITCTACQELLDTVSNHLKHSRCASQRFTCFSKSLNSRYMHVTWMSNVFRLCLMHVTHRISKSYLIHLVVSELWVFCVGGFSWVFKRKLTCLLMTVRSISRRDFQSTILVTHLQQTL